MMISMEVVRKKMSKPTKYYSVKQERMIADYLGWNTTPASGAKACKPGDIVSDEWIAECKTHVEETGKIIFYHKVWDKLKTEAMSIMKRPVLFVDNGTQKIKNTWCLISSNYVNPEFANVKSMNHITIGKPDMINISFNHCLLDDSMNLHDIAFYKWGKETVAVMKLDTFKYMLDLEWM